MLTLRDRFWWSSDLLRQVLVATKIAIQWLSVSKTPKESQLAFEDNTSICKIESLNWAVFLQSRITQKHQWKGGWQMKWETERGRYKSAVGSADKQQTSHPPSFSSPFSSNVVVPNTRGEESKKKRDNKGQHLRLPFTQDQVSFLAFSKHSQIVYSLSLRWDTLKRLKVTAALWF